MKARSIALLLVVAVMASACATKETKSEAAPPVSTSTPPPDQPLLASPRAADCQPVKNSKKSKKGSKPAAADCPPAAKSTPTPAPVAAAPVAAPAAEAPAAKPGEAAKSRSMKSRDGTFEGEVFGNIPPGSKWSKLQIGMEQHEVERILGVTHEVRHTPTGKAFMPFYYGTDRYRNEHVYRGQGSVSYTSGGHWGAGRGVLMMINYDPKI